MRELILIGGGGHCKSVINAAESAGRTIKGILDLPSAQGATCLGHKIIGCDNDIAKYAGDCDFVVTMGFIKNPKRRMMLHYIVKKAGGDLATIIASTANVSKYAEIEPGTVVMHGAAVNAGASIGTGCIINTHAVIEHDTKIGNYCHVSTGAIINGDCEIGAGTFIGSGAVVCNGVKITRGCIIGAGAVVTKDIEEPGVFAGVPARRI